MKKKYPRNFELWGYLLLVVTDSDIMSGRTEGRSGDCEATLRSLVEEPTPRSSPALPFRWCVLAT